ncbi:hypothetical protein AKJ09_03287 [Labilithrix luteola]|uniref:PKD domain-containing protein n=1 Tax=Labilithrix luteola TaxID=1391654 RepID=A0A0K1PSW0_9BACT|nr:PKD domain-containing protein [Labilithrix luteola]AKU96623.1 hypothetical protein AKJ09_03287 [Labilithrix luteola]
MTTRTLVALGVLLAGSAAFGLSAACGSSGDTEDGAACGKDSECQSRSCITGVCSGLCTCDDGGSCEPGSCPSGYICRFGSGANEEPRRHCTATCTGSGTCPSGSHCEDGICRAGDEPEAPITLSWNPDPVSRSCFAGKPCVFTVVPGGGSGAVDRYEWVFGTVTAGDAGVAPITTSDPTESRTFSSAGAFDVHVTAFDKNGTKATLSASQAVCITSGSTIACSPLSADECCVGLCKATADPSRGTCN